MRLCKRAIHWVQLYNEEGDVRSCSFIYNGQIGNVLEQNWHDIFNSKRAQEIRQKHLAHDFSECNPDACGYVACNNVSEIEIEIDRFPEYPEAIQLGFERVCNYDCTSCGVAEIMRKNGREVLDAKFKKIADKVRDILPHVKTIGANGCGELFASKHTLKLLSEWKPLAPKEEIRVELETNGSLFNEKNWQQIENLGQYYLHVSITIMSFHERTYQILSGTKLPISNLIANLNFIKKLREQGVINYLELATVVQERNFREMPEFAHRCIEEFGADYVRLRPYSPWGYKSPEVEWFTDIRGKYHPYHEEYLEVMKDPIFKHPKVHDLSGGRESLLGVSPYVQLQNKLNIFGKLLSEQNLSQKLDNLIENKCWVYGLGAPGEKAVQLLKPMGKLQGIIDEYTACKEYCGVPVVKAGDAALIASDVPILLTTVGDNSNIMVFLNKTGFAERNIYSLVDILD